MHGHQHKAMDGTTCKASAPARIAADHRKHPASPHAWKLLGMNMRTRILLLFVGVVTAISSARAPEPIPDRLVVLTFDDSSKSHFTVARPLLKRLGFGATFFITEGFDFRDNKRDYMTWEEIAQLHQDGFEIGNHTLDHRTVAKETLRDLAAQVRGLNARC